MRKIKIDRGKAIDDWIKLQDLIPVNLRICQITAFDTEIIHSGTRSPIVIPTIPAEHSDVRNMRQELQLPDMSRMLHEVANKNYLLTEGCRICRSRYLKSEER